MDYKVEFMKLLLSKFFEKTPTSNFELYKGRLVGRTVEAAKAYIDLVEFAERKEILGAEITAVAIDTHFTPKPRS